jgi:glycosyltransferase involved in cell wall biosynthesis
MKIAVYAISKNESQFVERFCNSAKDADLIIIGDTGSTDGTSDIAKTCGATVYDITVRPFRFDVARNAVLALVPADVDICIALDLDEVLVPGWRDEIERCWRADTTRMRYTFDWSNGVIFKSEKVHARNGYLWHHPVHERVIPDGRSPEVWADTERLLVRHMPDPTKSRGQYLPLLELSVQEDPHCPRNALYYARELTFYGHHEKAITAFNKYLAMPEATWNAERGYAMRLMGRSYEALNNPGEAEKWYLAACGEAGWMRDTWCDLAMLMYRQQRWEECFAMSMRALRIVGRTFQYMEGPEFFGSIPHDLASISAWHLGLKSISIEQAKLAVEKSPDDERLKTNLLFVTGQLQEPDEAA